MNDMNKIEQGDTVLHKPSGESWFVLGVNYGINKVCIAGYPSTIANLSDCELEEKSNGVLNEQEILHRSKQFGDNWDEVSNKKRGEVMDIEQILRKGCKNG